MAARFQDGGAWRIETQQTLPRERHGHAVQEPDERLLDGGQRRAVGVIVICTPHTQLQELFQQCVPSSKTPITRSSEQAGIFIAAQLVFNYIFDRQSASAIKDRQSCSHHQYQDAQ